MATKIQRGADFKGLARLKDSCFGIASECKLSLVISDSIEVLELCLEAYNGKSITVADFPMDPYGDYVQDVQMFLRGYKAGLATLSSRPWAGGIDA